MPDVFDVIIVGAGPAGIAAALTLARAGVNVVVFERGEFPGSKNMFGGILYTTVLNTLIPKFWEEAPIERHITRRRFSLLSEDSELALEFRTEAFNQRPPYNNSFSALRARFDPWFAKKAEEAGALVVTETVVDDLIMKDGKVVGVVARREGGEVHGNVVIAADGANSFLAQRAGLRKKFPPRALAVAVKEVMGLRREVIEERFCLDGNEGVAMEYFAGAVGGTVGSAFVYTNRDTLSVGLGSTIESMIPSRANAHELVERFKQHPSIKKLIRGAETLEFSAHLIPEGGYGQVQQMRLVTDGLILVGDAAGLVDSSFYHEGTNLAMASGVMAAETVLEAHQRGDFSRKTLDLYREKLETSFVLKDLKKYRRLAGWCADNPRFFTDYPDLVLDMVKEYFAVSEDPKEEVQRRILRKWRQKISLLKSLRELNSFRRAFFG